MFLIFYEAIILVMNMNREIKKRLLSFLRYLKITHYSLYIWWSYFFKHSQEDFFNWKSDIDVVVVIKKIDSNMTALLKIFDETVLCAFFEWYFDILNFNYRYGVWRNVYNIKFMSIKLFYRILAFKKLNFKSFRMNSLSQIKQQTIFYSNDLNYPCMMHTYKECKFNEYWYELLYNCSPFQKGRYYLTDLLSMLVFSFNIKDLLNVNWKLRSSKWYQVVMQAGENHMNMLRYYLDKWIAPLLIKKLVHKRKNKLIG